MKRVAYAAVGCLALCIFLLQVSFGEHGQQTAKSTITELQQKRLIVLDQVCQSVEKRFANGRIDYMHVLEAERERFAVRLEYAETREDRIKVCDQALERARELVEISQQREMDALGTKTEVLRTQDFELQVQIARANAETSN